MLGGPLLPLWCGSFRWASRNAIEATAREIPDSILQWPSGNTYALIRYWVPASMEEIDGNTYHEIANAITRITHM